ncbi:hypothetical protein ABZ897_22135 [Nonomuraea sp. NPDC046802]|uniref:hypothetical protein n=1 Tax=Nonomuraea sp. NPDC046802 TaxID=3154919 RepID=UPI003400166E
MPDDEPDELHQTADQDLRRVVAQAEVLKDWPGRQLSVLNNTYPLWEVTRVKGPSGEVWWTARLRRDLSPEMVAAGVMPYAEQSDAIALAATLAWQTYLVHQWQMRIAPR